MSAKQSKWLQFVPVLVVVLGLIAACIAMKSESAVHGEQIRVMQDNTRCLQADDEKQDLRILTVEKEMAGVKPAVEAVGKIAEKNAEKLDALLLRGH